MYCPRCLKEIDDGRLAEIEEQLRPLGNTLLQEKRCPVCGTALLNLKRS